MLVLALIAVAGCAMKPEGASEPTTREKVLGTWNGVLYVSGAFDKVRDRYLPGKHIGHTVTFRMEGDRLVASGEYRKLDVPVTARVSAVEFARDGVHYTADYSGGRYEGRSGRYSLWWMKSEDAGEQLKGETRGIDDEYRTLEVRLDRVPR